jgi:hypothetical protein
MTYQSEPVWKSFIGCLLLPFIPIAIILIPILNALGLNKLNVGPDYLIRYLEKFIAETEGEWDWDDFCSIPLTDPELDDIRERACEFAPPLGLTDEDREELRNLLAEAKRLQHERNTECS